MTPAAARATYRRQLSAHGEVIKVRRFNDDGSETDADVLGRVVAFSPEEIAAGVQQGERKVLLLAEDLEREAFPLPFAEGQDAIIVRGTKMTVDVVDDSTCRVASVAIGFWLRCSGA